MIRSRITGTGSYLPPTVVTNDDLAARGVDTSDAWVRARTGIAARHVLAPGRATSDMAVEAGRRACQAAGVEPGELDALIVATTTGDVVMPSCATVVQHKLGAGCVAFDIAAACAGFSHGLVVADSMIRSGDYRTILFVGADALSRYLDWDDRTTCVLFGDGAGAVVLQASTGAVDAPAQAVRGVVATHLGSDGARWRDLTIFGGGTLHGCTQQTVADNLHVLRMNGRVVFAHAVRRLSESSTIVLRRAGLSPADVDLVIPHQANVRIIEALAARLAMPAEKFVVNIERVGNTSAASIPIALDEAVRDGRVVDGSTLLLCGLGAGLTWGAAIVRW